MGQASLVMRRERLGCATSTLAYTTPLECRPRCASHRWPPTSTWISCPRCVWCRAAWWIALVPAPQLPRVTLCGCVDRLTSGADHVCTGHFALCLLCRPPHLTSPSSPPLRLPPSRLCRSPRASAAPTSRRSASGRSSTRSGSRLTRWVCGWFLSFRFTVRCSDLPALALSSALCVVPWPACLPDTEELRPPLSSPNLLGSSDVLLPSPF